MSDILVFYRSSLYLLYDVRPIYFLFGVNIYYSTRTLYFSSFPLSFSLTLNNILFNLLTDVSFPPNFHLPHASSPLLLYFFSKRDILTTDNCLLQPFKSACPTASFLRPSSLPPEPRLKLLYRRACMYIHTY